MVKTGGVSLKDKLLKLEPTGCNFPGCLLCKSGEKGGSTLAGARSAHNRFLSHEQSVNAENENNAFTKHLEMFHPERKRDMSIFEIKVVKIFMKCLEKCLKEQSSTTNELTFG